MINFVYTQSSNSGNGWRNGLMFFLLVLLGVSIFLYTHTNFKSAQVKNFILEKTKIVFQEKNNLEKYDMIGDAVFNHEPVITPIKNEDFQDFDTTSYSFDCAIAKDKETGTALFVYKEYTQHSIASITKLMTALVLLEHNLDFTTSTHVISDNIPDTHMYAGDTYTIEELWQAMLVASSNKAAMTLVDMTGLSREAFVARMNELGSELGMTETQFADPTGIDPKNSSSASDLTILLSEVLDHDIIVDVLLQTEHTLYSKERDKEHHMWNTDWLLLGWVPHKFVDFRGGKTGFIPSSGYNFVMEVGNKLGNIIDVVVLGTDNNEARFVEARDIANWVFDNYTWKN